MAVKQNRRSAIRNIVAGTAAITATGMLTPRLKRKTTKKMALDKLKGNINHSVCPWCYHDLTLEQLCTVAKEIQVLLALTFAGPKEWLTLCRNLVCIRQCAMAQRLIWLMVLTINSSMQRCKKTIRK